MTQLIRDVIEIPEAVHAGDFVLKLTEGVTDAEATVASYVVTPQLARCFDEALGLVQAATEGRSSKADYLHGSFGSGKSHFMAILYLLLQRHPAARAIPELAEVVAKHDAWLQGRKFLLVTQHMIGAASLESAVLGAYVDTISRQHPDAPTPPVYLSERIIENASQLRGEFDDDAFFAALNKNKPAATAGDGSWGELGNEWDADRFDRAVEAPASSEEHRLLVSDLVSTVLTSYRDASRSVAELFLPLDDGLSVISRHAADLGYDAVVLFLDELILWLASHIADLDFVNREGPKVAKLVEATHSERPAPIVSFIARQRDLRELVGEHTLGSQELGFADSLQWWEGRFGIITLEDRNLAAIVSRRLLAPKDAAAEVAIDTAVNQVAEGRSDVLDVLYTSHGDPAQFRQVYPFTPAFVDAVVAVSSALQRERTALRLMLQLLVERRDDLALGDVVPVGALWDLLMEGAEPFTFDLGRQFDVARKLYTTKLAPAVRDMHGLEPDDAPTPAAAADLLMVGTLLVAALVPEVDPLRSLTAADLVALNWGSVKSPIPRREAQDVLARMRRLASAVGEIRVSDDQNPTITLRLVDVDVDGILDRAKGHDNAGNRKATLRRILAGCLGIAAADELACTHTVTWRNTKRSVDVVFADVTEIPDASLAADGDRWKLVVDFPLDTGDGAVADDVARVEAYIADNEPTRTLVWLPSFLSRSLQKELGKLVLCDYVLTGERFGDYAGHLSAVDRHGAREVLENLRSSRTRRVEDALEAAYGIRRPDAAVVDLAQAPPQHLVSLDPSFIPALPVAPTLGEALAKVLDAALAHQYPAHPALGTDPTVAKLEKVLAEVCAAHGAEGGRLEVLDKALRPLLRDIAQPLQLGTMHDVAFLASQHWAEHFDRCRAAEGRGDSAAVTVGDLRRWIDMPDPMGLQAEVANLVMLAWADATNHTFLRHGGPYPATIRQIPDECELRTQKLPSGEVWRVAVERTAAVFGVTASPLPSAASVARFVEEVREKVNTYRDAVERLRDALPSVCLRHGVDLGDSARVSTTGEAAALLATLAQTPDEDLADALAAATFEAKEQSIGAAVKGAAAGVDALDALDWSVVEAACAVSTETLAASAEKLARDVREVLVSGELAVALAPALDRIQGAANRILVAYVPVQEKPERSKRSVGWKVVRTARKEGVDTAGLDAVVTEVRDLLGEDPRRRVEIEWRVFGPGNDE